ncbi:hypothetical protein M404DRAFT_996047 [Pisolithus tinctorius Marx 270]|uniref:Uncharacterized protein n=1 Tax=Pisolithus tinctorius Marx 270 TaxID=870435 RepID=A0A0C3PML1_PISTI|nr:hypothetical protein M404DRAFT_996047 [Pisolithus tinctorius Marx 270]
MPLSEPLTRTPFDLLVRGIIIAQRAAMSVYSLDRSKLSIKLEAVDPACYKPRRKPRLGLLRILRGILYLKDQPFSGTSPHPAGFEPRSSGNEDSIV